MDIKISFKLLGVLKLPNTVTDWPICSHCLHSQHGNDGKMNKMIVSSDFCKLESCRCWSTIDQCDQIGLFLKVLVDKLSCKSRPNV